KARVALQWGHGGIAVETRRKDGGIAHLFIASMGPRRYRRGNWLEELCAASVTESFNGATAVSPWKPTHVRLLRIGEIRLQWGHGGIAVETGTRLPPTSTSAVLQWGHGGIAV